jgi:hypothetical protein
MTNRGGGQQVRTSELIEPPSVTALTCAKRSELHFASPDSTEIAHAPTAAANPVTLSDGILIRSDILISAAPEHFRQ